ncbi:hypothetical protein ACLMAL_37175 [Nocardia sp. CWNU-33]|uniref:hypothetical protein n=1 Tax=Nocardia sp. CWNU-33 TaxID=3392117 RepID=UPI00398EB7F7
MAFFFTVLGWQGELTNPERDKCIGLEWFTADALLDRMADYCRVAMHDIDAGKSFSVYGW